MKISTDCYCFELPERWKDLVGVRKKGRYTDLYLLWEEDSGLSGLLVRLKCLKRKMSSPDDYTEYICAVGTPDGDERFLYASYGREGCVSEENEDLYWRLRDQLWKVFERICPTQEGKTACGKERMKDA